MKLKNAFCILTVIGLFAGVAAAQRNIAIGSPVTENFDGLGTGSVVLNNNVTIQGVYGTRTTGNTASPPGNTLPANNGSTNTGQLYNMGTTGAADRTFGTVSTTASGTNFLGFRLLNSGAMAIGSITVTYTGEEWRHGNGANEILTFEYQTGATVTDLTTGTWTSVAALNFTSPNNPPGQGALNGNLALNRTTISSTFAVSIPAGTEIMLRWSDIVDSAQPDGFGIDDLTVTAIGPTAAGATISGRVTTSTGVGIRGAAVMVTDGGSITRLYYTNSFGYYSVPDLPAGVTYFVSASARRYTFSQPTQLVNLEDNFTGVNFIAQ